MAEPLISRGLDWLSDWGDIVSDLGAALPFDLSTEPAHEPAQGQYDVATLVRAYQLAWLGEAPNHATPIELHALLVTLDSLTAQTEEAIAEHAESTSVRAAKLGLLGGGLWIVADKAKRGEQRSLEAIGRDLRRWRVRLDNYTAHVESVMPEREQDRSAVLWEVTAPLFLGWYGGPTGAELPIVGQPEGFDPTIQHLADVGSPFRIANMLGVQLAWNDRRKELFREDIESGAKKTGRTMAIGVAAGLGGLGVGVAAANFLKGRR